LGHPVLRFSDNLPIPTAKVKAVQNSDTGVAYVVIVGMKKFTDILGPFQVNSRTFTYLEKLKTKIQGL